VLRTSDRSDFLNSHFDGTGQGSTEERNLLVAGGLERGLFGELRTFGYLERALVMAVVSFAVGSAGF